jgi:DHA1 family inner membrane transport protein
MNHAKDAPTIGSSMNIAALNVGNAIGAWLCGIPLGSGGTNAQGTLWIGAVLAAAAAMVLLISTKLESQFKAIKQS